MKTCRDCKTEKLLESYSKQAGSRDGYRHRCKPCELVRNRKWRAERIKVLDPNRIDLISLKKCSICKKEKPGKEFYLNRSAVSGLQTYCMECNQKRRKLWEKAGKYRLKAGDYEKMLGLQHGLCGICGSNDPGLSSTKKPTRFQIDHDHETGGVRGLLCGKCNKALGLLNDDINTIEKALIWIQRGGTWTAKKH